MPKWYINSFYIPNRERENQDDPHTHIKLALHSAPTLFKTTPGKAKQPRKSRRQNDSHRKELLMMFVRYLIALIKADTCQRTPWSDGGTATGSTSGRVSPGYPWRARSPPRWSEAPSSGTASDRSAPSPEPWERCSRTRFPSRPAPWRWCSATAENSRSATGSTRQSDPPPASASSSGTASPIHGSRASSSSSSRRTLRISGRRRIQSSQVLESKPLVYFPPKKSHRIGGFNS